MYNIRVLTREKHLIKPIELRSSSFEVKLKAADANILILAVSRDLIPKSDRFIIDFSDFPDKLICGVHYL